jgi:hypothetical protein
METPSSISAMPLVTTIQNNAFSGQPITSFTVSASIESLGDDCFHDFRFLSEVTFAGMSRLKIIGFGSFYGCSSLRSLCIPASVEILEGECFSNCLSLTEFTFTAGSRFFELNEGAFPNCSSLKSIVIPKKVLMLKEGCFSCCSSLCSVLFESESSFPGWCWATILKPHVEHCSAIDRFQAFHT